MPYSPDNPDAVLCVEFYKDLDVFGVARPGVESDRIGTDDAIADSMFVDKFLVDGVFEPIQGLLLLLCQGEKYGHMVRIVTYG